MSEITMEQVSKFLEEQKHGETIPVTCGALPLSATDSEFIVNVKSVLTEDEKAIFVDRVVENSYINNIDYSAINRKNAFIATFTQMFTELPIPTQENDSESVDVTKLCAMVYGLNLIDNARLTSGHINRLLDELEMCIKQEIDFKNQKIFAAYGVAQSSNEAIETVSYLATKAINCVDKLNSIMGNIEDLSKDGKFLKVIPKKKLDQIFEWIQKIVNGINNGSPEINKDISKITNIQNIIAKENK